ncbi:MAG: Gfo/Idh/MocA family oxidoreductase [Verrucomicrobia bacterium]|nr:Gfo/Idh/MocA family oxidoreductase [Verrucomicrobiota bacterium]
MHLPATSSTRRRFLQRASLAATAPLLLPRRSWAADGTPPSQRITRDDIQVVAVCDVDTTRREDARRRVDTAYSARFGATYRACTAHNDYREVLARKDIDAVFIATPDHWHAFVAADAIRAGKDVYCEKPLTYNIQEALDLVRVVRASDRVFQTGSQQRSSKEFRVAAELVRNGILGRIAAIGVSFSDPPTHYNQPAEPIEPGLDWDRWCGPGPLVAYNPMLSPRGVHDNFPWWRRTWEFGGGSITDWGAHHIDIAQWALGVDGSGPVEISAPADWQNAKRGAQIVYANGTILTHVRGSENGRGVSFYGSEGELHVHRGKFDLILAGKSVHKFWEKETDKGTSMEREVTLTERELLKDAKVKLPAPKSHFQDFLDSIASRRRPLCDVEVGASSVIACHLMNFGYRYGANATWDPARHRFVRGGDPRWLTRERYRGDWRVAAR